MSSSSVGNSWKIRLCDSESGRTTIFTDKDLNSCSENTLMFYLRTTEEYIRKSGGRVDQSLQQGVADMKQYLEIRANTIPQGVDS